MSSDLQIVAYKAQSALLELADLAQNGPVLRITHRFWKPGTECLSGEEVFAAFLVFRGHEYQLRLSLSGRILLDYLARHKHCAQSATQIASGIHASDFYQKHGLNAGKNRRMFRRVARSAVKVHIARLRGALASAFEEACLPLDSRQVVVSRETTTNEVGYGLQASVEWLHVAIRPLPSWG